MAKINVYNKFGELLEEHLADGNLLDWIRQQAPSYRDTRRPPYSAAVNGRPLPWSEHENYAMQPGDLIDITIEPQDPVTWIVAIVAIASAAYAYHIASNLSQGYENATEPGKSIYSPNARANSAVPSGIIREVAGQITVFPDLICQPTRRYIDHEEWLYLMLSVGVGYFELYESNIYIDQTPIVNYAGDVDISIFEPGEIVSGHDAHENWYTSKEISALELTTASNPEYGVWTVDYSGSTITSYLDGTATAFPFVSGERFEITGGSNPGYYEVTGISGSSSEIATVTALSRNADENVRLETITQLVTASRIIGSVPINRRIFNDDGAPTLSSATGEAVNWVGVNGGINYEGSFELIPVNETARYCEVDVLFPQGLTALDGSNEETNATVEIEIQWRAVGADTWNTVSSTSYTAATYDARAYTVEIDFGSAIRPEMRFRRVTKDSEDISTADLVQIRRVKCLLTTPTSYSDITTIAMRLRGTNALAQTAENKINIRGHSRKLPTLAEMEAESYDLAAATTQVDSTYDVTVASLRAVFQASGIGNSPDYSGSEFGFDFTPDGLTLCVNDNGAGKIYTLPEAFRPDRGATYRGYITTFGSSSVYARAQRFAGSGAHSYHMTKQPDPGSKYVLSQTALTVPGSGQISYSIDSGYTMNEVTDGESFYVKNDGTAFWGASGSGQTIYQYSMSTPHDLSTGSYDSDSLNVSSELGAAQIKGFYLADSESKLYVLDATGLIFPYTISTPGTISTASYDGASFDTGLGSEVRDLVVTANFLCVSTNDASDVGFVHIFDIPSVTDNRATRSLARFVGWSLYDSLGDPDLVNWTALTALETTWNSRTDYLDADFTDETTLWEALKIMLGTGYSEPTVKEGKFLPVRTAAASTYTRLYTPDMMLGDGLQADYTLYDGQEPDGIDVEYFDSTTNQMELVQCRLSGDVGLRPKRIQAIGITDNTKAWRFGMRERRRFRHKPGTFNFTTEMDALNSEYGDAVALASEMFASQNGELAAYSAPDVTLDFEPDLSGAGPYYAAFKNREGEMSGLYTIIAGEAADEIELTSPTTLDFTPVTDGSIDATLVSIGQASEWGVRAIIKRITPGDEHTVDVVAEEYLAAVYADDDNSPP